MRYARNMGISVALRMTLARHNAHAYEHVLNLATQLGVSALLQPAIGGLLDANDAPDSASPDVIAYRAAMAALHAAKVRGEPGQRVRLHRAPRALPRACSGAVLRWGPRRGRDRARRRNVAVRARRPGSARSQRVRAGGRGGFRTRVAADGLRELLVHVDARQLLRVRPLASVARRADAAEPAFHGAVERAARSGETRAVAARALTSE